MTPQQQDVRALIGEIYGEPDEPIDAASLVADIYGEAAPAPEPVVVAPHIEPAAPPPVVEPTPVTPIRVAKRMGGA